MPPEAVTRQQGVAEGDPADPSHDPPPGGVIGTGWRHRAFAPFSGRQMKGNHADQRRTLGAAAGRRSIRDSESPRGRPVPAWRHYDMVAASVLMSHAVGQILPE